MVRSSERLSKKKGGLGGNDSGEVWGREFTDLTERATYFGEPRGGGIGDEKSPPTRQSRRSYQSVPRMTKQPWTLYEFCQTKGRSGGQLE